MIINAVLDGISGKSEREETPGFTLWIDDFILDLLEMI